MEQANIMGEIDMKEKSYEQVLEEFNDVDKINNPSNYKGKFGLEVIEVIKNFVFGLEGVEGFYWGNAIKYLLRFQKKNGLEDLKKARKNLDWLIEELEA
nr:MAG TPA: nucelotide kinase [Caudoviricetes sp.]